MRALREPAQIGTLEHFALLGLLGVGNNALQYLAVQTSTPLNVTLIAASSPLWMLLVGLSSTAGGQRTPVARARLSR